MQTKEQQYKMWKKWSAMIGDTSEVYQVIDSDLHHGIQYLIPNDESLYIVAIDNRAKLAVSTDFYEVEDLQQEDYAIQNINGLLISIFDA